MMKKKPAATVARTAGPAPGKSAARPIAPTASQRPPHGFSVTQPVLGSDIPMDLVFVLTRDEIYVPVAIRKPKGDGPFPVITMGRGDGRGGYIHVQTQVERLAAMQDRMIERGYVVVYLNYRNEIPHLYEQSGQAANLPDDISGGDNRTLKSAPTLDSDDFIAIINFLKTLPYVDKHAIGAVGVSHSGEMILKAAAQIDLAAGVAIEGASHEFLSVNTGPTAPRKKDEIQYQDIEVVRKNADKASAMKRIRNIQTPILHIGRNKDHLQGIFKLAHEWMLEAGKDSTWVSFEHPDHGFPYIYQQADGSYRPSAVQQQAFDLFMDYFDRHLKRRRGRK
ncbi:MAG: dienelactone hydrolase family protein [Burkholderiales bacterium]|nr:dienelactone hydrolase family protein [Burkholderiales bacterium]